MSRKKADSQIVVFLELLHGGKNALRAEASGARKLNAKKIGLLFLNPVVLFVAVISQSASYYPDQGSDHVGGGASSQHRFGCLVVAVPIVMPVENVGELVPKYAGQDMVRQFSMPFGEIEKTSVHNNEVLPPVSVGIDRHVVFDPNFQWYSQLTGAEMFFVGLEGLRELPNNLAHFFVPGFEKGLSLLARPWVEIVVNQPEIGLQCFRRKQGKAVVVDNIIDPRLGDGDAEDNRSPLPGIIYRRSRLAVLPLRELIGGEDQDTNVVTRSARCNNTSSDTPTFQELRNLDFAARPAWCNLMLASPNWNDSLSVKVGWREEKTQQVSKSFHSASLLSLFQNQSWILGFFLPFLRFSSLVRTRDE